MGQRPRVRIHGHPALQDRHRLRRHVLELVGDHVHRGRQGAQGFLLIETRLAMTTEGGRAGIGSRAQDLEIQPQGPAGQSQHAGQLPAAEDPDPHAGFRGSGCASTHSVCRRR